MKVSVPENAALIARRSAYFHPPRVAIDIAFDTRGEK